MTRTALLAVFLTFGATHAFSQSADDLRKAQSELERQTCPGDPPGDLGSIDCRFTQRQRLTQFVAGSVSDQAILSAVFFGTYAHIKNDPKEWDRGLDGFAYRVGSRYAQGVTKGLTTYTFSTILRTDPRNVSYASDRGRIGQQHCAASLTGTPEEVASKTRSTCGVAKRIGHAFLDWMTVRQSAVDGNGRRLPNLPLLAGAAASGFVGNAWYPDRMTTPGQALKRGAGSLGTALGSSFYTEFSPEVGRLLGALVKRRSPKPAPIAAGQRGASK
jgi:hypothetical protein